MMPREVTRDPADAPAVPFTSRDLILHGKPNWTAVLFFAALSSLHFYVAQRAFPYSPREALVSGILSGVFLVASVLSGFARTELTIAASRRRIRIRTGIGRLRFDRRIPFTAVHAVRVTLPKTTARQVSRIEILCDSENLECPPTAIPRQEALYLALVMGVRLIKVHPPDSRDSIEKIARL